MKLTQNEKSVLNIIATDEMNEVNGDCARTVEESATWVFTDQIAKDAGLTINQTKGVLGSLVKKGMIEIDPDEDEAMVQLTQEGIWEVND